MTPAVIKAKAMAIEIEIETSLMSRYIQSEMLLVIRIKSVAK
jgi:hypothetical protein